MTDCNESNGLNLAKECDRFWKENADLKQDNLNLVESLTVESLKYEQLKQSYGVLLKENELLKEVIKVLTKVAVEAQDFVNHYNSMVTYNREDGGVAAQLIMSGIWERLGIALKEAVDGGAL